MFCYIHIPFCRQKCGYCKFALIPFIREVQMEYYLKHLQLEIRKILSTFPKDKSIHSIYFGGGTPSVLSIKQVEDIWRLFRNYTLGDCEFTLEANPEDITKEWAEGVMKLGVNRISLGVQSLENTTLETIGRGSADSIFRALDILEEIKFKNVNVDFIIGLPKAKPGSILHNIQTLHKKYTCIKHTSVYFLEKGEYPKQWIHHTINDEQQRDEYTNICSYLSKKNWKHYEISNFSAPGYECKHNQAYWNHSHMLGFGLSAAGYIPRKNTQAIFENSKNKESGYFGKRIENSHIFSEYYQGKNIYNEYLFEKDITLETGIFQLRTFQLPKDSVCPNQSKEERNKIISENCKSGFLEEKDGKICVTTKGVFIIDTLMTELL